MTARAAAEKLVVGYTNLRSAKMPVPLAKEAGLFAKQGLDVTLVLEPGRVLVGNAGALLMKVVYTKDIPSPAGKGKKRFFIVDAAMNDLARPALYGSYHAILPVRKAPAGKVTA